MKTYIRTRKKLLLVLSTLLGLLLPMGFTSCIEDNADEHFYTFTGEMLGDYLENRSDTYSHFIAVLERAELMGLLKAYGSYTCFAPTNAAMQKHLELLELNSIDELPADEVMQIAYSHLIPQTYFTTDMATGAIGTPNMNDRYLMVQFATNDEGKLQIMMNNSSRIVLKDEEVVNGVVHTIDMVLKPSNAHIPDLIKENTDLSIFSEALEVTGLADSLRSVLDESYVQINDFKDINGTGHNASPEKRKIGYTVFVETNQVLARAPYNIHSLDDLRKYAKGVYDEMYPADKNITDETDRRNSLNRFIAYHLLDKTIYYNNFVFARNAVANVSHYEFIETMCPNTLLKVMDGTDGLRINRRLDRADAYLRGIKILSQEESGYNQDALNGTYHCIDDVLVYNKSVRDVVLNDRLRFDVTSLLPELMTNGIRGGSTDYCFPHGYFGNLEFSTETLIYYLYPRDGWANYQGDEIMALGQYDFTLRLPPVPKGTYEVRFGYTANDKRGVAQFYYDSSPVGIPLDLRIKGADPKIGWLVDNPADELVGIENDKMMRNRGYMKGPDTYFKKSGDNEVIARNNVENLRRIVGTFDMTNEPHYLRIKSVLDDSKAQFHFDYLEIVPKSVYGSSEGEDRH